VADDAGLPFTTWVFVLSGVPCVAGTGSGRRHRVGPRKTKKGFRAAGEVKHPVHLKFIRETVWKSD
jgi:hypothetical protein